MIVSVRRWVGSMVAVASVVLLLAAPASAAPIISNGGFESCLTGWTYNSGVSCSTGAPALGNGFSAVSPFSGTTMALFGSDFWDMYLQQTFMAGGNLQVSFAYNLQANDSLPLGENGPDYFIALLDGVAILTAPMDALVGQGRAVPCGLGARDTLRLEAGYPLYGHDIDATTTPFEAGLGWIVKLDKGADFVGLAALRQQKLAGVKRRLVGFKVVEPRAVARPGYDVYVDDRKVDVVRSGTVTPTANCSVGLTYLPMEHTKAGTRFTIDVRGNRVPAEVVSLPFVPRRTRRAVAAG